MSDEIDYEAEYEIDYEAEYTSLYLAVLDAGLHIIDGPKGRAVQMPLDASLRELLLDDRIRELEDRLHERDLAVAALTQDRDEAYDSGVRDGIERVQDRAYDTNVYDEQISTEEACWRALAAYNKEVERE